MLRFVIFAVIFFLGLRMARGFSADDALKLITGPVGIAVAAAASAVVVLVFLMMDTAGSSAGLVAVFAKDSRNAALVEYYGAAGRLYPAFITAGPVSGDAADPAQRPSGPRPVRRRRCWPLGTVAISLSLLSPVIPPSLGFMRFVFNYSAVLCLVLGLCLIWLAKTLAKRAPKKHAGMI